jgi:hypothetical protein
MDRARLSYPPEKIVEAVAQSDPDGVIAALVRTEFALERVEIVATENVKGLNDPAGTSTLHRMRLRLQPGPDDALSDRHASGYALIQVRIRGAIEHVRAHVVLTQPGGDAAHSFGRWTIEPPTQS